MKNRTYDFLVLGGGSAGYAAARTAHDLGLSTAVVDGAAELGGLCILRGCMPSKTLIESSNRYRSMRRASEFGLRSGNTEVHIDEMVLTSWSLSTWPSLADRTCIELVMNKPSLNP